jgi:hypothetical protein
VLGGKVRLRLEGGGADATEGPLWVLEQLGGQIRIPMHHERLRIGPTPEADLCVPELEADVELTIGPDRAWLYVTQGEKIFRRETRRTGVVAWELVKPPQPGL